MPDDLTETHEELDRLRAVDAAFVRGAQPSTPLSELLDQLRERDRAFRQRPTQRVLDAAALVSQSWVEQGPTKTTRWVLGSVLRKGLGRS